jgi:hypothetical protein
LAWTRRLLPNNILGIRCDGTKLGAGISPQVGSGIDTGKDRNINRWLILFFVIGSLMWNYVWCSAKLIV